MCRVRSTQGRDDYTQNSSMLERWAQRWSEKHPRALTPCFLLCCVIRRGAQHQNKVIWPAFKCKLKNGPSFSRCCFEQHVLDCSDQCPVWSADLLLWSSARSHLLCVYMSSHFQVLREVRVYFGKHLGKKEKAFLLLSKISNERFRSLYSTFCYLPVWFVFHVAAMPHFLVPGIENSWLYKKRKPTESYFNSQLCQQYSF